MANSNDIKTKSAKIVYTPEEEDWLVKIVLDHSSIIENKKTDGATNRDKDKAWEKIKNEFNVATPGKERVLKSLREKYSKIKKTLRDRAFYFSRDAKKTGGGPPKKELPALSEPMQQLAVLLTPSTLGLAATSGDSDQSIANESALQSASRKIASSNGEMQAISLEEIVVDDMTFCLNDENLNVTVLNENVNDNLCLSSEKTTAHENEFDNLPNEGTVDRTWERVNPGNLRKPLNILLNNNNRHNNRRRRKMQPEESKIPKLCEEKQQSSANKHKMIGEILEGEKERYKFERERAALDLKRAAIECERAEMDRERSAIELKRAKNQLMYDAELHGIRLSTYQPGYDHHNQQTITSVITAAAKKEYN